MKYVPFNKGDLKKYVLDPKDKNAVYKQQIVDLIDEYTGNIAEVAHAIGLNPATVRRFIKMEELEDYCKTVRQDRNELFVEAAETILTFVLNEKHSYPSLALKAAMFILERLGKDRGWGAAITMNPELVELIKNQDSQILIANQKLEDADCDVADTDKSVQ